MVALHVEVDAPDIGSGEDGGGKNSQIDSQMREESCARFTAVCFGLEEMVAIERAGEYSGEIATFAHTHTHLVMEMRDPVQKAGIFPFAPEDLDSLIHDSFFSLSGVLEFSFSLILERDCTCGRALPLREVGDYALKDSSALLLLLVLEEELRVVGQDDEVLLLLEGLQGPDLKRLQVSRRVALARRRVLLVDNHVAEMLLPGLLAALELLDHVLVVLSKSS